VNLADVLEHLGGFGQSGTRRDGSNNTTVVER